MSGVGHNSGEASFRVSAGELRQFIDRVERLEAEKKEIADQVRDVFSEARGRGYDVKVMRKAIARRKRDRDAVAEEDAVLEMYEQAILGVAQAALE